MKGKSTRYFYFYNNKISKVNIEMELDEQKDADYICNDYKNIKSSHENETKDMKITCDGRKVSVENLYIDYYKDLKDASREDVIKLAKESYDIKCE